MHLPLRYPAVHFVSPQPDVPALVLAASNEVQMCSLAWAATTKKGGPRGEQAAAGHTVKEGGEMLRERFLLVAELGLCLNKDLALRGGSSRLRSAREASGAVPQPSPNN